MTPLQLKEAKKAEAKRRKLALKLAARGYWNLYMGVDRPVPTEYYNKTRCGHLIPLPLVAIALCGLLTLALLAIAAIVGMVYFIVRYFQSK